MNICNCTEDLHKYFCDIPYLWRKPLVEFLCHYYNNKPIVVKKEETLTKLGPFYLDGNNVSIHYTNEDEIKTRSQFDVKELFEIIGASGTNSCGIPTIGTTESIKLLVETFCNVFPTTTTTTTSSSTTTTTTFSCPSPINITGSGTLGPTTTTTSSSSTTTTTVPPSTTTTTTQFSNFIARNISYIGNISNIVSPGFFTQTSGMFPINSGQTMFGVHTGGLHSIQVSIINYSGCGRLQLLVNNLIIEDLFINHNDIYTFSSYNFLPSDNVEIKTIVASCPTTTTTTSSSTSTTTTIPGTTTTTTTGPTTTTTSTSTTTSSSTSTTTSSSTSTTTSTSTSTTSTTSSTSTTTTIAQFEGYLWFGTEDPWAELSANIDSLTYQGTYNRSLGITSLSVDFPIGAVSEDGMYIGLKVPSGVMDFNNWNNGASPFNYGTMPDIAFRERITFGGFDYYFSRNPFFFDFAEPTYNLTLS